MTAIGRLRHRVTLQQPSQVQNDSGGTTTSWATVTTFWARVSPMSSSEQSRSDTLHGISTHLLVYRTAAAPTVDSTMRISWGGDTYPIVGIPRADELERFTTVGLVKGTPS